MNPVPTANAMRGILGDKATRAFRDALTNALTNYAVGNPANIHGDDEINDDYDKYVASLRNDDDE